MRTLLEDRYSRHILLKEIGEGGQKKIADMCAVIIGIGGLGGIIANNLTRLGVGKLKIVDRDCVELNNLHRQILFDEGDIDQPKAVAAAEKLKRINSDIEIIPVLKDVNFSNIELIIHGANIIIDGTDNMETRFLINDASVKNKIPWIYGGAIGTYGMTMNILPDETPCFRCFFHTIPRAGALPTCDTVGILNAIPVVIGAIESVEALKIMLHKKNINKKLLIYDIWSHEFHSVSVARDKNCKCCVHHDFEFLAVKKRALVSALCGRKTVQITPIEKGEISLLQLSKKLERVGTVRHTEFTLIFKLPKYVITIFKDGRAVIKGTSDEKLAKSLYARYIGT